MKECKCTFAQKMIGDGCSICNPQLMIDLLLEHITELEQCIAELESPKTCERCKWYNTGMWSECVSCSRNKLIIDHYCKTKE